MCMSYKNLTSDLRTTTWTEQCLCSASPEPLAGQSKVPYLYDPFNFEVFEGKWPIKVKIFENSFFWKSLLGHWSTCLGLICWKSVVGKLIVGPGVLHKKKLCFARVWTSHFTPCPKVAECCHPLTCACVPNFVRISLSLPELFPKDWFFGPNKSLQ